MSVGKVTDNPHRSNNWKKSLHREIKIKTLDSIVKKIGLLNIIMMIMML